MIRRHKFLKESKKYGISDNAAGVFYDGFEKMLKILEKYHFQWEKLSDEDWKKLLVIEDELQWPVLEKLPGYLYQICQDADDKEKGNVILFRNSIQDEIALRKNEHISQSDYTHARKHLIERRLEFLLAVFDIDKESFWKTAAKIALASGVVIGTTTYLYKKYNDNKGGEEKENK